MENISLETENLSIEEPHADWEKKKEAHPLSIQTLDQYDNDPWAQPNNENDVLTKHDTLEEGQKQTAPAAIDMQKEEEGEGVITPTILPSMPKEPVKSFQNVEDKETIDDLKMTGQIPRWLTGEYFTVGPGTFDVKYNRKIEIEGQLQLVSALYTFGHLFDALPLVNRFDLNGPRNTITYRNKLTSRRLIEKIRDHHGYSPLHPAGLFMSNTNQTVLSKILKNASKPNKPDAEPCSARILTKIPGLHGRLFCQNHASHIQELDPFDLKPTRLFTWSEVNPAFKGTSSCPNGQYDSRTGEYINFTMEVGYQSVKYHFFSLSDGNPKGSLITSISAPMAYVNTFSITPRYIIFVLQPMLANSNGVKYNWCESILDSFSFKSSEPTVFYVISREQRELVAMYRAPPCFIMNHINAYEEEDNVYLDMVCYEDDTIARQLNIHSLRQPQTMSPSRLIGSELRRYRLARLDAEQTTYKERPNPSRLASFLNVFRSETTEQYSDLADNRWYSWMPLAAYDQRVPPSIELPQISPRFKLHKHSFVYGLGFSAVNSLKEGAIWDSIVKINVETKSILSSWHQEGCYPSEPVFVPRPEQDSADEDDGVLLSVVMNATTSTSFLLVLDAVHLKVLAIADLERLVPISFAHGDCRLLEAY
ncbi:carotenoid oxygenase [Sporodiniella umbellata]|nr:carotenoid oxygenase [Sporodiniella umbellata]